MKQFAVIGIGKFGNRMLEEFLQMECELLIVDKSKEIIDLFKDKVTSAYIADAINEETIRKLIPPTIDGVIVDFGDNIEVSILVTNYLKKIGLKNIIVKAETDEHGEILEIVGASYVIFPNREAAKRIVPIITSSQLFNYMPISAGLVIAEVKVPLQLIGKTLIEADLRKTRNLNVIAIRKEEDGEYEFFSPDYRLKLNDVFLVAGKEEDIFKLSGNKLMSKKMGLTNIFKRLFTRTNK